MYDDDKTIVYKRSGDSSFDRLSANFTKDEWFCKCGQCEDQPLHHKMMEKLEALRSMFGEPITITSGYRCPAHNEAVGGAAKSRHMVGDAADIKVRRVEPVKVARAAKEVGFRGIKVYPSWTHVDLRPGPTWFVGV